MHRPLPQIISVCASAIALSGCISFAQTYRHLGKQHKMTSANRDYHRKVISEAQSKHGLVVGSTVGNLDESSTDARLNEQSQEFLKQARVYDAFCDDLRRAASGSPDGDGFTSAGRLLRIDADHSCEQAKFARRAVDRIASILKERRDRIESDQRNRAVTLEKFIADQMPDLEAVANRIKHGQIREMVVEDKATATIKCQGQWAADFPAMGVLSEIDAQRCGAVRSEFQTKLFDYVTQRDIRVDEGEWAQANAPSCMNPAAEDACDAVNQYLAKCPPYSIHCEEARKIISSATPKLNALRARREAAEAAEERREAAREAAEERREAAREAAEERREASRRRSSSGGSSSIDPEVLACCHRCNGTRAGVECVDVEIVCYNYCIAGEENALRALGR